MIDKSTKVLVYHYLEEKIPLGFPSNADQEARLYEVTALPDDNCLWDNLAFDGDLHYDILYSLMSTFNLSQGLVNPNIISCHK